MNSTTVDGVLHSQDILPLIFSCCEGKDLLNIRLVCQSWNAAGLFLLYNNFYFDLKKLDPTKHTTRAFGFPDGRLFSSLKLDRFDTKEAEKTPRSPEPLLHFVDVPGQLCSQLVDWTGRFSYLQEKGARILELKLYCRGSKDWKDFVQAAKRKLLVNLEKLVIEYKLINDTNSETLKEETKVTLEPQSLVKLRFLKLRERNYLEEEYANSLKDLVTCAQNLEEVETNHLHMDLTSCSKLKTLRLDPLWDWDPDEFIVHDEWNETPLAKILSGVNDRLVSLHLSTRVTSLSFKLPVFPKLKKLRLGTEFRNPDWVKWFPELENFIAVKENDLSRRQVHQQMLIDYLSSKTRQLSYMESDCFMDYNGRLHSPALYQSLLQLPHDALNKEETGRLAIWIRNPGDCRVNAGKEKDADFCWNTMLNSQIPRLILKVVPEGGWKRESRCSPAVGTKVCSNLQGLVDRISKKSTVIKPEHRQESSIEFVFIKVPVSDEDTKEDEKPEEFPKNFSVAMQKLAKRWGRIKIRNLEMTDEAWHKVAVSIRKLKIPLELYKRD